QGRPVIQAGSYGAYVGVLDLVWDPATKTVTSGTARNVAAMAAPAPGSAEEAAMLAVGNVATIKAHVDAALAEAATKGDRGVAQVTADITTAQTKGEWVGGRYVNTGAATRDDRANESSLATLVADAFLAAADGSDVVGGADIGVINAGGGLRAELLQAPDGKITYAEANAILPFVNNIYTVTLTGAQLKTFLEEQWQTDADGNRPARPFLATGVSSNVTYTVNTDVPTAEPCTLEANCGWDDARSHVTSVSVNGAALDAAKEYKVVTISFLTSGGDNYRVMTQGKDVVDTGLVDRDLWIETLMDLSGVAAPDAPATDSIKPSFARSSVVVTNLAPATAPMASVAVEAGAKITATLSRLNLTSLGAVANTDTLSLLLKPSDLTGGNIDFDSFKSKVVGQGPVTAPDDKAGCAAAGVSAALNEASTGCSKLDVTIPATTTPGEYVLLTAVFPSETLIWLPVTVREAGGATESSTPPTSSTSTSASGVSSTSFTLSPTSSSDLPGTGAQANRATVAAAWLATIVGLALILIAAQRRGANASNRGL
ncbi:MAG: bifunctional metallophosphatase/5'-nucleotidase, partial [Propionibacteriaceae bacterium]|nr:bifunctional metallophosphatase/5'-nucleotidase [Propionibacteriaceae bacterium]